MKRSIHFAAITIMAATLTLFLTPLASASEVRYTGDTKEAIDRRNKWVEGAKD